MRLLHCIQTCWICYNSASCEQTPTMSVTTNLAGPVDHWPLTTDHDSDDDKRSISLPIAITKFESNSGLCRKGAWLTQVLSVCSPSTYKQDVPFNLKKSWIIIFCHTSLIFMSKLSNAIGANSVTCRVLECDVLQNKCSNWLKPVNIAMFTGEHWNSLALIIQNAIPLLNSLEKHQVDNRERREISALGNVMLPRGRSPHVTSSRYIQQSPTHPAHRLLFV